LSAPPFARALVFFLEPVDFAPEERLPDFLVADAETSLFDLAFAGFCFPDFFSTAVGAFFFVRSLPPRAVFEVDFFSGEAAPAAFLEVFRFEVDFELPDAFVVFFRLADFFAEDFFFEDPRDVDFFFEPDVVRDGAFFFFATVSPPKMRLRAPVVPRKAAFDDKRSASLPGWA